MISNEKMGVCTTSSHQSSSSYYFKQCINEGCCYWWPFAIDQWTTAGDDHGDLCNMISMIFGFWMPNFEFSKEQSRSFFDPPWETPSFLLPWTL
jgi:hypothetical protein